MMLRLCVDWRWQFAQRLADISADRCIREIAHMQLVAEASSHRSIVNNYAYLLPVVVSYEKGGVATWHTGIQTIILDRKDTKWVR